MSDLTNNETALLFVVADQMQSAIFALRMAEGGDLLGVVLDSEEARDAYRARGGRHKTAAQWLVTMAENMPDVRMEVIQGEIECMDLSLMPTEGHA